jgi:cell division protease FtsH
LIDKEVKAIVDEQYKRAKTLIEGHREQHKELSELLVEKEVIFADDVERIFGKRPWTSRQDELSKENKKEENLKEKEEYSSEINQEIKQTTNE